MIVFNYKDVDKHILFVIIGKIMKPKSNSEYSLNQVNFSKDLFGAQTAKAREVFGGFVLWGYPLEVCP